MELKEQTQCSILYLHILFTNHWFNRTLILDNVAG